MAIVKETTAGTLKAPTGGTDFVELQPDLQMTPNFDALENEAIRASIGKSKPIQGVERPEAGFSHYLKHSGTEGTAPEFGDILESLFGATSANGTERSTTAASTVSLLKLAAGGSDFARGKAVLIKDGTNGYSLRPVHSVSGDDLTLGFHLANAPATGIPVGKCVNFAPANSGHPTLSIHSYQGNGQILEAIAGAVCSSAEMRARAGDMLNMNFSFQGTKYFFNPIVIAAADRYLDFNDGTDNYAAVVEAKTYRDPHELASALTTSMNALGAPDVYTVSFMDNDPTYKGKFLISTAGATLSLLWNTGANTANTIGDKLGFSVAADDTASTSYYSDNVQSYAPAFTPAYDSSDPLAAKNFEIMLGDATDYSCFCAQEITAQIQLEVTDVGCICAESGVDSKKITSRMVTMQISALLDKHDADKFRRYRENTETRFAFNFGEKVGGNWVAGKCGILYVPTATISAFSLVDLDTVVGMNMTLTAFVDSSGNGEVYLNFL